MTVADETASPSLSPTLLGFITLICLFGLLTNSYAANYMTNNFDLSKMTYKILLWSCLIHVFGCVVILVAALYLWVEGTSEFICIVFQISLLCPIFIVESFMLQMSILRCIICCSKKSAEELNNFQKSLVLFMTPLPFAYIGPLSIYRLANDKSLGYAHLVSFQLGGIHKRRWNILGNSGSKFGHGGGGYHKRPKKPPTSFMDNPVALFRYYYFFTKSMPD